MLLFKMLFLINNQQEKLESSLRCLVINFVSVAVWCQNWL